MKVNFSYSAAQHHIFHESAALGRFRLFPKGRRLGATRGAAHACIEWALEGKAILWGDTISANIGKYVDRYFVPALRANGIQYSWNQQKLFMRIGSGHIDFRSADRPENWEGFGYHIVFLNEAGIILDDEYLFHNAVLPMMLDHADSTLIAAGTPKLMKGKGALFAALVKKAEEGVPGYHTKTFTTYDNPWLSRADIQALADEIPAAERAQEIDGKFVRAGGVRIKREWFRYGEIRREPNLVRIGMGIDLAITEKQDADGDWAAITTMAKHRDGRRCVLDVERRHVTFHALLEWIKQKAETQKPDRIKIEANQFQASVVQELLRTTSLPVSPYTAHKDKVTRFGPTEIRYEKGMVYHAPGLPSCFEEELLAFPVGDYDDMVDSTGLAEVACTEAESGEGAVAGSTESYGSEGSELAELERMMA